MTATIHKYPRTQHLEGSRLQPGDEDLEAVPFRAIAGRNLVVEEKVDGANCGLSFTPVGGLLLQSRGHYLTGGVREKHFNLFKQWAQVHAGALWERIGSRYIVYGEWLYAKHTVFYDALPHYFLEFDVLDKETGHFLSTPRRHELLAGLPIVSVLVLFTGKLKRTDELTGFVGPSRFIRPGHLERLREECRRRGFDVERAIRETDPSGQMEGLYVKIEEDGQVVGRYKYIRAAFLQAVFAAEGHWLNRPIVPNLLRDSVDLFQTEYGHHGPH
ncbi:MAG: RNA ligase family protein [Thermoguttaceae bacterium]